MQGSVCEPIQHRYFELVADRPALLVMLSLVAERARTQADRVVARAKRAMGFAALTPVDLTRWCS